MFEDHVCKITVLTSTVYFLAPEVRRARALIPLDEDDEGGSDGKNPSLGTQTQALELAHVPFTTIPTRPTPPPLQNAAPGPSKPPQNPPDADFLSSNMSSQAAVEPPSNLGSNILSGSMYPSHDGSYGNGYPTNHPDNLQNIYNNRSYDPSYRLAPQVDPLAMEFGPMFDTWTPSSDQAWHQLGRSFF